MTLAEASKKWKTMPETIISHIAKGEISGLKVENNILLLPDIPKPHFKTTKMPIFIYRGILAASQKGEYIDECILHITKEMFRGYIQELVSKEYLRPIHDEVNSSLDYILTEKGTKYKENKIEFNAFLSKKNSNSITNRVNKYQQINRRGNFIKRNLILTTLLGTLLLTFAGCGAE